MSQSYTKDQLLIVHNLVHYARKHPLLHLIHYNGNKTDCAELSGEEVSSLLGMKNDDYFIVNDSHGNELGTLKLDPKNAEENGYGLFSDVTYSEDNKEGKEAFENLLSYSFPDKVRKVA